MGDRYFHSPKAQEIGGKFNAWLPGKLVIGVEDIYVAEHRLEVLESLKPIITESRQEVEGKGVNQGMSDICANFIFNSNHKDAVRMQRGDRRYAIFYTAQQTLEDLQRDGMTNGYFPKLYRWLKQENGYAIVNHYLHTFPIDPEFNPAGECDRAPDTSSTSEVLKASMGNVELEIIEAIETGRQGFLGGWVSSIHVDELLRSPLRKKMPDILLSLGYVKHPGLPDGRATRPATCDGNKKPRLYVLKDRPDLLNSEDPVGAYVAAQTAALFTSNT